jgi:hypothetical protein
MDMLKIDETFAKDESIEEYEYHEYEPITGANLNNPGEIRISVETQDIFYHPSESYLIFEGRLTKADGTAYGNDDVVTITNNGMMHLFSNIKYHLSGQEIESLFYPGQTTTMLGLLKYPDDFQKSQGLNQLWYKDAAVGAGADNSNNGFVARHHYLIKSPDPKGTFSFRIPLKHIFGFAEDYDKVVYGFRHVLTLVRKSDDDAIFRLAAAGAGKITLSKVSWYIPHVRPADGPKLRLYEMIEKKVKLDVGFRMRQCESISVPQSTNFSWRMTVKSSPEKPRYIIVAFQTEKDGNQEKNPSIFDHVKVKNMYATLNSTRYPVVDYDLSFAKQQFSRAYGDAASFRAKYYNMDELVSNPNITPSDYKDLFPLFVFNVSKQSEKLKYSITDIQIKAQFNANVPAGTEAFALVISDRILSFESDGNKMTVVS